MVEQPHNTQNMVVKVAQKYNACGTYTTQIVRSMSAHKKLISSESMVIYEMWN